jgi:hypothetical protein
MQYSGSIVLDDAELRQWLKLPPEADIKHYRERQKLPYRAFKVNRETHYRYLLDEVVLWFKARSHNQPE